MESNCTNCNENVYFACRKKAASYNEKLNSRESAAELLGISPSTLANHELGITKSVPVDTVVMMADLYKAPELKISISADGNIDAEEIKDLDAILESLDNLAKTISELRMLAEKFTERG